MCTIIVIAASSEPSVRLSRGVALLWLIVTLMSGAGPRFKDPTAGNLMTAYSRIGAIISSAMKRALNGPWQFQNKILERSLVVVSP